MITWSAHLSMLFASLSDAERPAAAHAAGFRTVDSWWPEREQDRDAFADELRRLDLDVALINFPAGDVRAGARGRLNVAGAQDEALADFDRAIALAAQVGAQRMNLLTGIERRDRSREDQLRQVADLVGEASRRAASFGIEILIEPLNLLDVPGYLIADVPAALDLLNRSGEPGRVLYDVYHAARGGRDPIAEIGEFAEHIGHVHYADHPGRGAPGSGTLDLERILDALAEAGYEGAVGLEFDPSAIRVEDLAASLPTTFP